MSLRFAAFLAGAGIAAFSVIAAAASGEISGRATVIDGNTIEIDSERIRILDIDAPEISQLCFPRDGRDAWACGQAAADALAWLLADDSVTCKTEGTDYVGRWFAQCYVATLSIAAWMAGNGWAVPNQECTCEEVRAWAAFARGRNAGIWASEFQMPWEWRKAN